MTQKLANPFEVLDARLTEIQTMLVEIRYKPPTPPPTSASDERYLDSSEVQKLLGISSVTVWQWEKDGILKSYRIGNLKRFKHSEILAAPKKIERVGGGAK